MSNLCKNRRNLTIEVQASQFEIPETFSLYENFLLDLITGKLVISSPCFILYK